MIQTSVMGLGFEDLWSSITIRGQQNACDKSGNAGSNTIAMRDYPTFAFKTRCVKLLLSEERES